MQRQPQEPSSWEQRPAITNPLDGSASLWHNQLSQGNYQCTAINGTSPSSEWGNAEQPHMLPTMSNDQHQAVSRYTSSAFGSGHGQVDCKGPEAQLGQFPPPLAEPTCYVHSQQYLQPIESSLENYASGSRQEQTHHVITMHCTSNVQQSVISAPHVQ